MAAREPVRDRKSRLERGGEWLREQRKLREWSGVELARRLGLDQTKVSAYEHGRYEINVAVARRIARVLDIPEVAVWRGLELPLPAETETDDALVAYARERWPNSMAAANDDGSGPKAGNPGTKKPPRPRTGESGATASPDAENA